MCSLLLATVLTAASPCSDASTNHQSRIVTDRELAQIRGGRALFPGGRNSTTRVTQDATVRDFTIAQTVMSQQFDNWLNDVATPLIAAELLR